MTIDAETQTASPSDTAAVISAAAPPALDAALADFTIRPRPDLLTTALLAMVVAMVPLFGVLYWFAIPKDSWLSVLVLQIVVTLACAGLALRQLAVFSTVTATELIGNGIFSPAERVPLAQVSHVDLVKTYVGQSPEAVTQVLVRDASGRRVFRLRGTFWHEDDLTRIAALLPVRPNVVLEPLTMKEFFREYPGSAYWFENKPALTVASFVVGLVGALVLGTWLMTLIGVPVAFLS